MLGRNLLDRTCGELIERASNGLTVDYFSLTGPDVAQMLGNRSRTQLLRLRRELAAHYGNSIVAAAASDQDLLENVSRWVSTACYHMIDRRTYQCANYTYTRRKEPQQRHRWWWPF